ncbi:MAG TPA: type II CAAX endopeptidase family protein [Solirubrobacteraceae bacterium]
MAAIVLGLVASQLAAGGLILAAGGDDAPDAIAALGLVVADLVILGVVVLFARRGAERLAPATLGIRQTRLWPAVGWMIAIYFGVLASQALWAIVVTLAGGGGGGGHSGARFIHMHLGTATAILVLMAAAVSAPIVEEISFRGYLFPALTRWRGPWSAAVLTAILFGAAHILVYPPILLPLMVCFGFGACLLFWFTGSLLPGVALHALNNALVVSIAIGWSWQVPLAVIACVAAAVGLLAPLARERAPQAIDTNKRQRQEAT